MKLPSLSTDFNLSICIKDPGTSTCWRKGVFTVQGQIQLNLTPVTLTFSGNYGIRKQYHVDKKILAQFFIFSKIWVRFY